MVSSSSCYSFLRTRDGGVKGKTSTIIWLYCPRKQRFRRDILPPGFHSSSYPSSDNALNLHFQNANWSLLHTSSHEIFHFHRIFRNSKSTCGSLNKFIKNRIMDLLKSTSNNKSKGLLNSYFEKWIINQINWPNTPKVKFKLNSNSLNRNIRKCGIFIYCPIDLSNISQFRPLSIVVHHSSNILTHF